MQEPCHNCPFKSNIIFSLRKSRRESIVEGLKLNTPFICHKTSRFSDMKKTVCIGSAILLEKEDGLMSNFAYELHADPSLGKLNPDKLNMNAPVFNSYEEFINAGD